MYDSDNVFGFLTVSDGMSDSGVMNGTSETVLLSGNNNATEEHEVVCAGKAKKSAIDPHWLLLDSEATKHIFRNKDLLTDIQHCEEGIMVHGQFGTGRTH